MENGKENLDIDKNKLKNFSEVSSFDRLSDRDSEQTSQITAGGDVDLLKKDIEDEDTKNT
jgi:hypothetical protein